MATLSRIERVLRHDGIVAVLDLTADQAQAGQEPSWVGDDKWRPIVLESVRLRQIADEPQVRVLVGEHAVLVVMLFAPAACLHATRNTMSSDKGFVY